MALELTLPFGSEKNVKNLVFSILTKEHPLKLIDLLNFIRKRYGRSVTFQAVRKATLQLVEDGVLVREENEFSINIAWVLESRKVLDRLSLDLQGGASRPRSIDSIKGDVTVFTFTSLAALMKFWEEIIDDWFSRFKKGDLHLNCWQGAHMWEGLLYPEREHAMMAQLKKKGIKSSAVCTSNTPLDKYTIRFFASAGVTTAINATTSAFDKGYYVGTYGATVVQTQLPEPLVKALDEFFRKNTTIERLSLQELSSIVNQKCAVKLTVIKSIATAQHINQSILAQL